MTEEPTHVLERPRRLSPNRITFTLLALLVLWHWSALNAIISNLLQSLSEVTTYQPQRPEERLIHLCATLIFLLGLTKTLGRTP